MQCINFDVFYLFYKFIIIILAFSLKKFPALSCNLKTNIMAIYFLEITYAKNPSIDFVSF